MFLTVDLKTFESPLDCKEIKPINPKGNQSWIFIGRADAEAEAPILWPPDGKSWLIGKEANSGKDWGQEENRATEDEMVGWHHRRDGHEFEYAPGVGDGQGSLACAVHGVARSRTWLSNYTDWLRMSSKFCLYLLFQIILIFLCILKVVWVNYENPEML